MNVTKHLVFPLHRNVTKCLTFPLVHKDKTTTTLVSSSEESSILTTRISSEECNQNLTNSTVITRVVYYVHRQEYRLQP